MQQIATVQIQTAGCCNEDTSSVHESYTSYLGEIHTIAKYHLFFLISYSPNLKSSLLKISVETFSVAPTVLRNE